MIDSRAMPDRQRLFAELIALAFLHQTEKPPVVVRMRSDGDVRLTMDQSWPEVSVSDPSELPSAVTQGLVRSPVLVMPPWGRRDPVASARRPLEEMLFEPPTDNDGSLLGLLVPAALLTNAGSQRYRQELRRCWTPLAILTARAAMPNVHHQFEVAFILLSSTNEAMPLKMFRLPNTSDSEAVTDEFRSLLRRQGGSSTNGYVLRELPAASDSLGFEKHNPDLIARAKDLSGFGSTQLLGDVFEILFWGPGPERATDVDSPQVRVIHGRDILPNGGILPPEEDRGRRCAGSATDLRQGDFVMRGLSNVTDSGGLVVAHVTSSDLPAAAGDHVVVLRPKRELEQAELQLLDLFFRSGLCKRLVMAGGGSAMRVTPRALRDLPLPSPDAALSEALTGLGRASAELSKWHEEAERVLDGVFEKESASVARTEIISGGRKLRQRVDAAELLGDFDFAVRTRFPYPIAHRWRSLEAHRSGNDLDQTLTAALDCFESLLAYGANIAMVMAAEAGVGLGSLDSIREKLCAGRSGPSLGDWIAVLEEAAASKQLVALGAELPLGEIRTLLAPSVMDVRRRLTDRRNDQAHLRRPKLSEAQAVVDEALTDLTTLMGQAIFLTDLTLIHVNTTEWDSFHKTARVRYRALMGDHPVVPYRTTEQPRSDLEAGSLYIADTLGGWHLLRPFLVGRECPDCFTWSTFHVDRMAKGRLTIKSLERGHTIEDESQTEALRQVGLL